MEFLASYGLFLLKAITIVIAILIVIGGAIALASRGKDSEKNKLIVKKLNEKFDELKKGLESTILSKDELKKQLKEEKKAKKLADKNTEPKKRIFVLHFNGDMKASAVSNLREEITALLTLATPQDEVVLCLESPGGMVHGYGLAATQLTRLRDKNIPLTVVVDKVAASGGYMMAAVANRIVSAPFAIIGSIGVLAQIPNFHRLLKNNDIDFEQITAGEYKRTLTFFGENTEAGRDKFKQEIEEVHLLFKEFIKKYRPHLDIDKIATGEHWLGTQALQLQLVDELKTSDDYLLCANKNADLYEIRYHQKKTLSDKLGKSAESLIGRVIFALRRSMGYSPSEL